MAADLPGAPLAFGLDPPDAIDAPTFHATSAPSSFWLRTWTPWGLVIEERAGGGVIDEPRERGHDVTVSGPWSQGRLPVVTRDPDSGVLQAAAGRGLPAGVVASTIATTDGEVGCALRVGRAVRLDRDLGQGDVRRGAERG